MRLRSTVINLTRTNVIYPNFHWYQFVIPIVFIVSVSGSIAIVVSCLRVSYYIIRITVSGLIEYAAPVTLIDVILN